MVSSDGVELAVHDLGGKGPPLILTHATGFHGRVWGPLSALLSSRFHCWSFDFRGHGDSTRPRSTDFEWPSFGHDVLDVVTALGLERPFGLGHSQGATALLLAEQMRPGTFQALYLYEPVAFSSDDLAPSADDHPLVRGALRRHDRFPSTASALEHLAERPPLSDFDPEALRAYVDHGLSPLPGGEVVLKCRPADEAQIYRQGLSSLAFDRLDEVKCPVIVARGSRSDALGATLAARQVARLSSGRLQVLEGLGHFGPLEDPRQVAAAVAGALLEGTHEWPAGSP